MPKAKVLLSNACLAHYSTKDKKSEGTRTRNLPEEENQHPVSPTLMHRPYSTWIKNSPRSFKTGFVLICMCSECIDDIVAFKSAVTVRLWMSLATNLLEYYFVMFVWLTRHVHWFSFTFPALHRWHLLPTADGSKGSRSHNKHPKLAQRSSTGHPH